MYSFKKFKEFYEKNFIKVRNINEREFGYGVYNVKIKKRHLHFKNNNEFNNFLREIVPFYVSASLARYRYPDARPMEKKDLICADFAFDIDADTKECLHPKDFVCEKCMNKVKENVFLLLDILKEDFGLNKFDIIFSGNRGYHIYVHGLENLNQREREEIVKYCIFPNFERIIDTKKGGWYRRFKEHVLNNILYFKKKFSLKNPPEKIKEYIEKDNWNFMRSGISKWKEEIKKRLNIPDIDVHVTTDMTKLLRVPETLHGGSGLKCVRIKDLYKFDPFHDPIAFSDDPVLFEGKIPSFPILGVKLQEYQKKIPEYLAIYLELKGYGRIK